VNKEVILTGIRANNDLHIGNYFGALLPIIDMAKNRSSEYRVNLFIPDLHSFTTPIDHSQLQAQIINNLKIFAAAGLPLDNPGIHVYRQSYIPAHSELTWILDCFTGFGEMGRMTQFKDRSAKLGSDRVSIGVFNYPVLMAADILLYNAKYVPVGDDQTQHLEFTRDIAERLNKQFGDLFKVPEPVAKQHEFFGKDQGLRIRDLIDPTKKMSKSDNSGKGIIFLGDKPEDAALKILSATTDSIGVVKYDPEDQPGISNLLEIYGLLKNYSPKEIADSWETKGDYRQLKKVVANYISEFLTNFQNKLSQVDESKLLQKLESDEAAMAEIANATLLKVQKAVGLR
jgi:tryptophanyl-tRNA synthetase